MTDSLELMKLLSQPTTSKIIFLVLDGLGGLPHPRTGQTELETAHKPNLDKLATDGICGLSEPVGAGITPGSTPGHLALFGYDPVNFNIGRGVVEAVGIDFDLKPGDVAARGNFCAIDKTGVITDRRAGRISTEQCAELCRLIDGQEIEGVKVFVQPVKEHRFVAVFRGKNLSPQLSDSDPQHEGLATLAIKALSPNAKGTSSIVNQFVARTKKTLAKHHPANMVLLRGFSQRPHLPGMAEVYRLKSVAIASYPMYRGLARLVGMKVVETGTTIAEEFKTLTKNYQKYDFFFLHVKGTDSAGEDGDFEQKVKVIEQFDRALPQLVRLKPDVIVVIGDHSTPAVLKGHSWHPVPVLLYSRYCRRDAVSEFSESACLQGGLGRLPATQIMPLTMANALKLNKFGA